MEAKIAPPNTYIHQMLTPIRNEPHYQYFNPRHVTQIKMDEITTKNMFNDFQEDTFESYEKILKADF